MLHSLILSLLSIFAVFGFFCLILFSCRKNIQRPPVVICTYNDEKTIENDIRSAMADNPGSEIIIVDIGSNDETEKLVKIMSADYHCIKFVERPIIKEKQIDKS